MNDARSAPAHTALDDGGASGSENTLRQDALDDPRAWESEEPVTEPMSIEALLERRERVSARKDAVSFAAGQAEPSTRALTLPVKSAPSEAVAPAKLGPWASLRRISSKLAPAQGFCGADHRARRRLAGQRAPAHPEPHSASRPASSTSTGARESTEVIAKSDFSDAEGSLVAAAAGPGSIDGQKGGPTLQREAADAVLAGELKRALALYRRLSVADPHASVYQEAARVIEARLEKAGGPP